MSSNDKTRQFADLMRQTLGRPKRGSDLPAAAEEVRPSARGPAETPAETPADASRDVADFVSKMKQMTPAAGTGRGRLIFAMDATMSRQPTWDMALQLQGQMFDAVRDVGGLDVQLVFYRGFGECRHSRWVSNPEALARLMTQVGCRGGQTQIGRVLTHAKEECEAGRVNALVFVGDAFEEDIDAVCQRAGELSLLGVPAFMFQEGRDPRAEQAFKEIARLTKGAWCRFDAGAAQQLRELLTAVAVYAAGGRSALARLADRTSGGHSARLLLEQVKR